MEVYTKPSLRPDLCTVGTLEAFEVNRLFAKYTAAFIWKRTACCCAIASGCVSMQTFAAYITSFLLMKKRMSHPSYSTVYPTSTYTCQFKHTFLHHRGRTGQGARQVGSKTSKRNNGFWFWFKAVTSFQHQKLAMRRLYGTKVVSGLCTPDLQAAWHRTVGPLVIHVPAKAFEKLANKLSENVTENDQGGRAVWIAPVRSWFTR